MRLAETTRKLLFKQAHFNRFIQENTIESEAVRALIKETAEENEGVIDESFISCLGCTRTSVEVTFFGTIVVN